MDVARLLMTAILGARGFPAYPSKLSCSHCCVRRGISVVYAHLIISQSLIFSSNHVQQQQQQSRRCRCCLVGHVDPQEQDA